jgi:hypothetical protein
VRGRGRGWGIREGVGGKRGEMTQALYADTNKRKKKTGHIHNHKYNTFYQVNNSKCRRIFHFFFPESNSQ